MLPTVTELGAWKGDSSNPKSTACSSSVSFLSSKGNKQ